MTDYAIPHSDSFAPAARRTRRRSSVAPWMLALVSIAFTILLVADTPLWYEGAGADLAVVGLIWALYLALMFLHAGPLQRRVN